MEFQSSSINQVQILSISGIFSGDHAAAVRSWLDEATSREPAYIVVNMKDVRSMDSAALSLLLHGMKKSRQLRGDLRLCSVPQPVRMIFEITRLDKVFEFFLAEEDAVEAFYQS